MTGRQKHRPTLPTIPIPSNNYQSRALAQNGALTPLLLKPMSNSRKLPGEDLNQVDPDDLFIRFTIPEIKAIQSKLRADADAKQEELRLMVGERYRDLLQASTSIVSIADSSCRVMGALSNVKDAIVADESQRKPRSSSIRSNDDAHLKALQSLSAHLKLLLDAPEHLWRLLEKKQHLQAAWLFLLARVVHRALVTEDPEEGVWKSEGINVLRQWDIVAQFRPQIVHRATQYLRETSTSSEDACSTVLTLHLLDSLPLKETLSTLLHQRSRTLNGLLSHNLDARSFSRPGSPIFKSRGQVHPTNGLPTGRSPTHSRNRKDVVREVRTALLELFDIVYGTMGTNGQKSFVERSLEDIHSGNSPEIVLTTSALMTTLPSSTHLLTLPPSILSYKPYIDLKSPSSHVDPVVLHEKVSAWFDKAMGGIAGRVQVWFSCLESIREVWSIRRKVLARLHASQGLEEHERSQIQTVLDNGVKGRVGEVMALALGDLEKTLDTTLRKAVHNIKGEVKDIQLDINPSTFLFSAPTISTLLLQIPDNAGTATSPLKRFKDAVRQRVEGRTPLLYRVLSEIESKAHEINKNLDVMKEDDDKSQNLKSRVMEFYYGAAQVSAANICVVLERILTEELSNTGTGTVPAVNAIVFVGRLCYYLSLSPCISSLRCRNETVQALDESLNRLHELSLDTWRTHAVSKAITKCNAIIDPAPADVEFSWPSQPSSYLVNAFLSLISSLDCLGLPRVALMNKGIIRKVLQEFQLALMAKVSTNDHTWRWDQVQLLWDLTFLEILSSRQMAPSTTAEAGNGLTATLSLLRLRLQSVAPKDAFSRLEAHIDRSIHLYLPRSQTLIAPLITTQTLLGPHANGNGAESIANAPKAKATALLSLGVPESDKDYRPAMETVRPSARFGLLLVGSTGMR
ncbi:hypothetical protein K439DRAFT_1618864 [Ramaria rubella]|nr:hypothetical protein K439DRAFT_1618864 [Ramaria rubella]